MALMDEGNGSNMVMPVAPMGGGYGNGNDGFFGSNGIWFLILFILLGGWGNGFGGYGGGNGGIGGMYPWMNQSNQMNEGFRDQMKTEACADRNALSQALVRVINPKLYNAFIGKIKAL